MEERPEKLDSEALNRLHDLVTANIPRDWWGKIEFTVRGGWVQCSSIHQTHQSEKKDSPS